LVLRFNFIYQFHIPGFKIHESFQTRLICLQDGPINKVTSFYNMFYFVSESMLYAINKNKLPTGLCMASDCMFLALYQFYIFRKSGYSLVLMKLLVE